MKNLIYNYKNRPAKSFLWFLKSAGVLIALFAMAPALQATHVIGGNMYYRCLGGGSYEITLEFRRDCFNGAPNAQFDNPLSMGIYDALGNIQTGLGVQGQLRILLSEDDTLGTIETSVCEILGEDVCVQSTTYKDTVFLPNNDMGYFITYQRCCRNRSLNNIVDPTETGASYFVEITPEALDNCNSSPVFNNWPAVYICNNTQLSFDHSAFDREGDSLVYEMCHPFTGASSDNPQPIPPAGPPYSLVEFAPPFDLNNLLGGSPLSIDPNTGLLTALPDMVGQYLVGICVKEYRDGVLLSTSYRDFQYNVRVCIEGVEADFTALNNPNCSGLDITFENNSTSGDYEWFFEWPDTTITSTEMNPTHSYAESGSYEVVLVVRDSTCTDTARVVVGVSADDDLAVNYGIEFEACSSSLSFNLIDSTSSAQGVVEWAWTVSYGDTSVMSTDQNPHFDIDDIGLESITVDLTVTGSSGCTAVLTRVFDVSYVDLDFVAEPQRNICAGDTINLINTVLNPDATYIWSPDNSLDLTNPANPLAFPTVSTNYMVTVTEGFCTIVDSIFIEVGSSADIQVDFDFVSVNCNDRLVFELIDQTVSEQEIVSWDWQVSFSGGDLASSMLQNPLIVLDRDDYDSIFVELIVTGTSGCPSVLRKAFAINYLDFELSLDNQTICLGESIDLVFLTDTAFSYTWSPITGLDLSNPGSPSASPEVSTTYFVTVTDGLCSQMDSITVNVDFENDFSISGETLVCQDTVILEAVGDLEDVFEWYSDSLLTNSLGNENPLIIGDLPLGVNSFFAVLQDDVCATTRRINVERADFDLTINSPVDNIVCTGTTFNVFLDPSVDGFDYEYIWSPSELIISGDGTQSPVFSVNMMGDVQITYTVRNTQGCEVSGAIDLNVVDNPVSTLEDVLLACPNTPLELNPNGETSLQYQWTSSISGVLMDTSATNPIVDITQPTTFIVTITVPGATSCQTIDTLEVDLASPINMIIDSYDDVICFGENITLNASSDKGDIVWTDADGNIVGDNPVTIVAGTNEVFTATATDADGCIESQTITLDISDEISIEVSPDALICGTGSTEISVTSLNPSNELSYVWEPSNLIVGDNTSATVTVDPSVSTTFNVVATDAYGCTASTSVFVTVSVFTPPVAITADPNQIILGESTELDVNQDPNFTYEWSPSSTLDDPTSSNPTATPTDPNSVYMVTVTNDEGCTGTAQVMVEVVQPACDETDIYVPNMFTPNGDDFNDVYRIEGNFIEEFYILIYDRWGEEMFESNDQNTSWDGRYKSQDCEPDVYGYYIRARCVNGVEYITKGNVTLVR